ncbi:MAG: ribosome small subunit-dependent GTPase A [Bacilli bacterium]
MSEGIIFKLTGGNYYVKDEEDKIFKCRARGKFRNNDISPLVGDRVKFEITEEEEGYIMHVLPRKNELYRPKVANVDYGLIVTSVTEPKVSSYLLDKLIVLLELNNIEPILLFTKIDKCKNESFDEKFLSYYQNIGYDVYVSSNIESFDENIKFKLKNHTTILVGQTGVGKSTFINNLDKNLNLKTGEISKALGRGRHTTRHVEIFYIEDIRIIDSPGFSSMEFLDTITVLDIARCFREFYELSANCKFATCIHINEPKCNVKDNLSNIYIKQRYDNYNKMIEEIKR